MKVSNKREKLFANYQQARREFDNQPSPHNAKKSKDAWDLWKSALLEGKK